MMLRFLTAGESHGPALVAILEGIPAGLVLSPEVIDRELARRQRGYGSGGRMKIEKDVVKISGGVMGGVTTGGPLAFVVENADHVKWKGKSVDPMTTPRPGHADLTGAVKYGYHDLRPALERASARETTMRVAVGAVCKHFLAQFDVIVGGYVQAIGDISANLTGMPYLERFARAETSEVRCPEAAAAIKMLSRIEEIMHRKDTLGGILEVIAVGVPAGLGSFAQWDRRLDARLGAALLSIQAIKGVEMGDAWENARRTGTQAQDAIQLESGKEREDKNGRKEGIKSLKDNALSRPTNRAGGIEGGISNGQPIVMRAAMKPIATTLSPQASIDLTSGEPAHTRYERSDFCPVPRAVPILEAMAAFVLAEALIEKLGGDSMDEMKTRFASLRKARLGDLRMDGVSRVWWE
jgi:chorismate synthase